MKTYNYRVKGKSLEILFKNEQKEIMQCDSVLIQVFSGEGEEKFKSLLAFIEKKFPHATIIAASTDGEIYEGCVLTQESVISVSLFSVTKVTSCYVKSEESFDEGVRVATNIVTPKTKLVIAFTDGIATNGEAFLRGFSSVAKDVKIAGGLAGDNGKLKKTLLGIGSKLYEKGVVAVALDSDVLHVETLYHFGWRSVGLPHKVTASKGNRVYSIDNMTTVEFYTKYLGESIAKLLPAVGIEFPLIMKKEGVNVARASLAKYEDGSLSFAGNIAEGTEVYIGIGSKEEIIQNPIERKSLAVESFFIYSCMARRRFLPDTIQKEIEHFAKLAKTSGFFTYGEFYTSDKPELLNQTLTAVALSESLQEKKLVKATKTSHIEKMGMNATQLALMHILEKTSEELIEVTRMRK